MAQKSTLMVTFKNIANSIRVQSKGSEWITPSEMPSEIESLPVWKYGMCGTGVLGDVDQNGELQPPTYPCTFTSSEILSIPEYRLYYKFVGCRGITEVNLPNCTTIGQYGMYWAFYNCQGLVSVDMGNVTHVGDYGLHDCFNGCTSLRYVNFKNMSNIDNLGLNSTFENCTALELIDWSNATKVPNIGVNTFKNASSNFQVIIPDSLYSSWRLQTNWYSFRNQLVKLSEYNP